MISYVQGSTDSGHHVNSVGAAFASPNTAGNLILVCVGGFNGGTLGTLSVSDSQGNAYTLIQHETGALGSSAVTVWYAENVKAGANTVTVSVTGASSDLDVIVAEYAGLSASAPLTASSIAVVNGSSVSASAITPAYPNSALVLFGYDQSNSGDAFTFSCSPTETFTQRNVTSNTGGGESSALSDSIGTLAAVPMTSAVGIGSHSNALFLVSILLTDAAVQAPTGAGGPALLLIGKWSILDTVQTRSPGFPGLGVEPITYSSTALPPGLTLYSSTGNIGGLVTASGTYTFTVTATDATGATASVAVTASISAVSPVDTGVCACVLCGFAP